MSSPSLTVKVRSCRPFALGSKVITAALALSSWLNSTSVATLTASPRGYPTAASSAAIIPPRCDHPSIVTQHDSGVTTRSLSVNPVPITLSRSARTVVSNGITNLARTDTLGRHLITCMKGNPSTRQGPAAIAGCTATRKREKNERSETAMVITVNLLSFILASAHSIELRLATLEPLITRWQEEGYMFLLQFGRGAAGRPMKTCLPSSRGRRHGQAHDQPNKLVLRRPVESALGVTFGVKDDLLGESPRGVTARRSAASTRSVLVIDGPADHAAGAAVAYSAQVPPALTDGQVGDVGAPDPVELALVEPAQDEVGYRVRVGPSPGGDEHEPSGLSPTIPACPHQLVWRPSWLTPAPRPRVARPGPAATRTPGRTRSS